MEHPWLHFYDPATPHTLTYPDVMLDQFLDEAARNDPERTAITFVLKYALGGLAGALYNGRFRRPRAWQIER